MTCSESNDMLTSSSAIISPKIELSPPAHAHQPQQQIEHYEPQRQTVLMWGSAQQQQQQAQPTSRSLNSTPIPGQTGNSSTNRSSNSSTPATTPTNGQYVGDFKGVNGVRSGMSAMVVQSAPTKWSGGGVGISKHAYYEGATEGGTQSQNHYSHQEQQAKGNGAGSGEVWSSASTTTAYHSQYQYFTYHAPAHHPSTQ